MDNFKSYQVILQDAIDPGDTAWSYTVSNLPDPCPAQSIKCISVVSSASKQHIQLRFEKAPSNRITRSEPLENFVLISFTDFRLRWPPSDPKGSPRVATARESGDYIAKLLKTGVVLNGKAYHFFGHSNSQLKSKSCFLYSASKEQITAKIDGMGDFSKLKSVGKKAKRIGLLFSTAEMALELSAERCEDIEDVTRGDYIFTDGCGLISIQLAKQLAQRGIIVYRGQRYLPSVFQIRYRGYKGVLTLDRSLVGQIQVQFRQSMKKFKDAKDLSFAVVDFSKPYAFSNLNDEVIILLHSLGISKETLLRKQSDYLHFLRNVFGGDSRAAFQFLSFYARLDLAEKLLIEGVEAVIPKLRSLVKEELSKMQTKRDEQRCRILIPKSRLLFGVCDPEAKGKLRDGECFVRITLDGDGRARTIINTEVLVTRNPCLHPGDLQKFKAVDVPEFSHLTDCIVFPTRGKRPSADLMSGGDLDGDKFFVTWDPDIIPSVISEPAEYPGAREPIPLTKITDEDRAEYFARYTNASLGQVKNLYLKWARLGSAQSPECQQLNRLFSQCVDGNRIKIPQSLQDPPEPKPSDPPFILEVLHRAAEEFIEEQFVKESFPYHDGQVDSLDLLLCRDKLAVSEFELIKLTLLWCKRHDFSISDFAHFFNFGALSDEEQIWVVNHLPLSQNLVRNGLLQSNIVRPEELTRFRLDHHKFHWRAIFDSSIDRMGHFLGTLCRSLELFHKKLIILQVDERLAVAIYVPTKVPRSSEIQVDDSVRVFAFPRSQGHRSPNYRVMPTKVNYRLFCDETSFQLYELKRANTWIFLTRSQLNDAPYRAEKRPGDRRRLKEQTINDGINYDCRISVALQKISKDIQTHVGRVNRNGVLGAEIYAISNRDIKSMAILDQWLHYVDTEEVLPLFQNLEIEYKLPKMQDEAWDNHSPHVAAIARDGNFAQLRNLGSEYDLLEIFNLLWKYDDKPRLRLVYTHSLEFGTNARTAIPPQKMARILMEFLPNAVYLVPLYLRSQLWAQHKASLEEDFITVAPKILTRLVLSANSLHGFVRDPFLLVLQELKRLSLQEFAELGELIALSVRSSETALDLFLEVLEPETSRLLVGRPLAIRQFVKSVIGIALDHIDEATSARKSAPGSIKLVQEDHRGGYAEVKCLLRIDSPVGQLLRTGDHVRLTATTSPQNAPIQAPYSMDALVLTSEGGSATFRCLHDPPSYLADCAWNLAHCGPFVTSKTMIDAVTAFYAEKEACCRLYASIAGFPDVEQIRLPVVNLPFTPDNTLNQSQSEALEAAMTNSLVFLWGPPGTGKTHTIVVIMKQMLQAMPKARFLVTAPTHNAVDNLLRRFVSEGGSDVPNSTPIRVSNALNKVSPDLRGFTCDAMVGKEISANMASRRQAQKRIKESRLVFTTCAGSGLGLLRTENFEVVLVDEASQQTEPETLIPLVKGCSRAILVGDHVQLRATVQQNGLLVGLDISLFERHYKIGQRPGVAKVMLDTQYRMHRTICNFSSSEFYESKLKTAVPEDRRPLGLSQFPWPRDSRMVFVECSSPEDLGRQSKSNRGQVDVCRQVCELLKSKPKSIEPSKESSPLAPDRPLEIAILTPYTNQKELLKSAISSCEVNSIDGYQGREADIIILVTVRCNMHRETGFLKDMRRLNVAMTRARTGVIIIGNKTTLSVSMEDDDDRASKDVWKRLVKSCVEIQELPQVVKE